MASELRTGFLSQEPCFYKFHKMTQNMFNQHAINCRVLLIDKLVMNPGLLSGVPDFFDRNKILSGYDLSHYQVPHCIRVLFYFV